MTTDPAPVPADILIDEGGNRVLHRVNLEAVTLVGDATDDRDPPEFPDVNPATGDERETTGLDEHGDPL